MKNPFAGEALPGSPAKGRCQRSCLRGSSSDASASCANPVNRLILHLYAFSNHEPRQTNHGETARSSFLFIMEDADFRRVVDGLFEFILDFLARAAIEFADDVDGDEREEESRYDFVKAEPGELFPNEDG